MCGNIDRNELISSLTQSVRAAFKGLSTWTDEELSSSRHWTTRLFSELDRLAKKLGVDVRHKPTGDPNWEFLYDVCFLGPGVRDPDGYFTRRNPLSQVFLVLECEWGSNKKDILYDFSKLLMARSKLRSFVFCTNSKEKFESILGEIKSLIAAFKQGAESDRYLICGIVSDQLRFVLIDGRGNEQ